MVDCNIRLLSIRLSLLIVPGLSINYDCTYCITTVCSSIKITTLLKFNFITIYALAFLHLIHIEFETNQGIGISLISCCEESTQHETREIPIPLFRIPYESNHSHWKERAVKVGGTTN